VILPPLVFPAMAYPEISDMDGTSFLPTLLQKKRKEADEDEVVPEPSSWTERLMETVTKPIRILLGMEPDFNGKPGLALAAQPGSLVQQPELSYPGPVL
jgi:hypothetical protein